jgi:hypothetical protein
MFQATIFFPQEKEHSLKPLQQYNIGKEFVNKFDGHSLLMWQIVNEIRMSVAIGRSASVESTKNDLDFVCCMAAKQIIDTNNTSSI